MRTGTKRRVIDANTGLITNIAATMPAMLRTSVRLMTVRDTKPSTSLVSFCTRDITRPVSFRSKKDMESLCM